MRAVFRLVRSLPVVGVLAGILSALCILGIRSTASLEPLELGVYDWLLQSRPAQEGPDPRLALITITEQDILNQGRWPITDATLAQVLDRLAQYQPRAIGLDIYRDFEVPPGHEELNALFTASPHIVAVTKLGGGTTTGIPPPDALRGTEQVGFNDILIDSDGIVRRGLLFQDTEDQVWYAFALRLALLYLAAEGIYPQPDPVDPQHLRLGPTTLRPFEAYDGGYVGADAGGYQILLDFQGARSLPPSFSLTALLSGQVDSGAIQDKIVLIGVTAESVPDLFHTPYSSGFQSGRMIPGVTLHAQIVSQLLGAGLDKRSLILTASETQETLWILLWGVLGGVLGLWARSPWRFSVGVVGGLFILTVTVVVVFWQGWWIPLVPPALAWFLSASVVTASVLSQERKQRALLMQLFSRHVSGEVAEAIWRQREQFLEHGRPRPQQLVATVLFTDFKGYTAVSEKMEPEALMDWVNTYLDAMSQLVMVHDGVIDDYAGDAIKANFGVPLKRASEAEISQDAQNAVMCALDMEQEMHRLNRLHEERGLPTVGMRIGIYTGPVVAGSVGSSQRLKYTTVGDTVNVAARLESLDRELVQDSPGRQPCRILIGESTHHSLGNRFETERVGEVSVKGKEQPLIVYRVVGRAPVKASETAHEEG